MYKILLIVNVLFLGKLNILCAQNTFNWYDSTYAIGQTKLIRLVMDVDGPCTLKPCYENNKQTYDTLIYFLKLHQNVSVVFLWHTATIGSSQYNFYRSKRNAQGLIDELIQLGIIEDRVSAMGMGESQPKINEIELKKIKDIDKRFETDVRLNNRIEIIITSTPDNL